MISGCMSPSFEGNDVETSEQVSHISFPFHKDSISEL